MFDNLLTHPDAMYVITKNNSYEKSKVLAWPGLLLGSDSKFIFTN